MIGVEIRRHTIFTLWSPTTHSRRHNISKQSLIRNLYWSTWTLLHCYMGVSSFARHLVGLDHGNGSMIIFRSGQRMNRRIIELRVRRQQLPREGGFMSDNSTSREAYSVMTVLAFVCCDDDGGIFRRALYPFLHNAFAICAAIIAPAKYMIVKAVRFCASL